MPAEDNNRLYPQLEFWTAVLGGGPAPLVSDEDVQEALSVARKCLAHSCTPRQSFLAYYIYGKAVLLQRSRYPEWQRWVAYSVVLAGEGASSANDATLRRLWATLLEEYALCVKSDPGQGSRG